MAKLNDPPPTAESVEALKRRFTRQNRDLARTNSAQSQRIRNLETEISRLLAENIGFREAAIAAQKELERSRSTRYLEEGVRDIRDKLQKKLDAVAGLVEELGGLPDRAKRKEKEDRRRSGIVDVNAVRSPDERDWRNKQTLASVLGQDDGRLPPILEDKQYPRRTLEPLEIQNLRHNAGQEVESESPEVGPPPIASFDDVDVMPHHEPEKARQVKSDVDSGDEQSGLPIATLEIRRKRRTSSLLQDLRKEQSDDDTKPEVKGSLFRSGAKRKLDASDLEELADSAPVNANQQDDFAFQRKPSTKPVGRPGTSRFARPSVIKENGAIIIPSAGGSPQKPRKVLAPKSTNSPTKRNATLEEKPSKPSLDELVSDKTRRQAGQTLTNGAAARNRVTEKHPHGTDGTNEDQNRAELPPKTPAVLDEILSPISSEPSASHTGLPKRGAQEAAIINSVEDVLNGSIGRASRRAKAAISYAEPKLNVKMRRPGKELVGAIEGIHRKRDSTDLTREYSRAPSEDIRSAIKQEVDENKWRNLPMVSKPEPTSPLSDKKDQQNSKLHVKPKIEVDGSNDVLNNAIERLSIFDPPNSSPSNCNTSEQGERNAVTEQPSNRKSTTSTRRHSVMPSTARANSSTLQSKASDRTTLERPNSAASNRSDKARDAIDLKRSNSIAVLKMSGGDSGAATRAERMASRRRSMMI